LIREWKPEPLCPPLPESAKLKTRFVVESATGRTVRANGGETYLNFAANNFLGLADRPETKVRPRHRDTALLSGTFPSFLPFCSFFPSSVFSPILLVLLIAVPDALFGSEGAVTKDTDIISSTEPHIRSFHPLYMRTSRLLSSERLGAEVY